MNKTEKLETLLPKNVRDINTDYKGKYGFSNEYKKIRDLGEGIDKKKIKKISELKKEPKWMLRKRLKAFEYFTKKKNPKWGPDLSGIDYDKIHYFVRATDEAKKSWEEVPEEIKNTFERLGVPQAERKFLAGVASQYESEVVYHKLKEKWQKQGIIFEDTDTALKKHSDIFKKYFGKIVPYSDNKLAALNTAVWSGGTFIYVPKGLKLEMPLQAYFRINAQNMGQFERTLIIADEGSEIHYIEGCTAPVYSTDSLHAAVVEIVCMPEAKFRYTTLQNWSTNVYNLVTKRAYVYENANMEWVDCNLGSKVTMKYPSVHLIGDNSHGEVLSIALAGEGQHQDAGAKIIHKAKGTSSIINSKSICKDGGRSSYRGLLKICKGAEGTKSKINCDALILDDESQTDTYPTNEVDEKKSRVEHEASVSKVSEDQLFYLMSRGLTEEEASALVVSGFIEPVVKELPMEYAMELNALIQMSMEGSIV
ncbi:Fe-S cluster assembly protein SufB [Candidatus Dojkabacteria bacterium]|nr:Fe-S cluster assembly protein SufB [Candidatus Dojkabacteria bacterium]